MVRPGMHLDLLMITQERMTALNALADRLKEASAP